MKFSSVIIAALLGVIAWQVTKPQLASKPDPAEAMGEIFAEFPRETKWGKNGSRFFDVSYDVQKTDSLVNPLIGLLNFSEEYGRDLQFVFHWTGDRWVFAKMICRNNGMDHTQSGASLGVMSGGAMRPFLIKHGWNPLPLEQEPEPVLEQKWDRYGKPIITPAAVATPAPRPIIVPKPTPDPLDAIREKYGTRQ